MRQSYVEAGIVPWRISFDYLADRFFGDNPTRLILKWRILLADEIGYIPSSSVRTSPLSLLDIPLKFLMLYPTEQSSLFSVDSKSEFSSL